MITTPGRYLLEQAIPTQLRASMPPVFDKKGAADFFAKLAQGDPDEYRRVVHQMSLLGGDVAYRDPRISFGVEDIRQSQAGRKARAEIEAGLRRIMSSSQGDQEKKTAIIKHLLDYSQKLPQQVLEESKGEDSPLAVHVASGAGGNASSLNALRGFDLLYNDQRDRPVPIPILRSYSQGLRPAEYFAGAFGTRRGVVDVKLAVGEAGALAKYLTQAAHRLVVSGEDGPPSADEQNLGLPAATDDNDSVGALLARQTGRYPRNTVVTGRILQELKKAGIDDILVRSPTVGGAPDGTLYARDVGRREYGGLLGRGEAIGPTAAQSISEIITQLRLSSKHSGGVAGVGPTGAGFKTIEQLVNVPRQIHGGAAHATRDGVVTDIRPNSSGGTLVAIDGHPHFVPPDRAIGVKKGDSIEAGDVLSDGVPHPAIVTHYKGVGEGRRYFTDTLRHYLKSGGVKANRRNIEVLARALINHVQLTEENEYGIPDDIVNYSTIAAHYQPREGAEQRSPESAKGMYLERPALHYTIGTKIRPSVVQQLKKFGVGDVQVHREPPPFVPEQIPADQNLQYDPDWMTRMYGTGLKGSFTEAMQRGRTSTESGSSFVPVGARGVNLGLKGLFQTPEKKPKIDLDSPEAMIGGWKPEPVKG